MRTILLTTTGQHAPVAADDVAGAVTQAREAGVRGFVVAMAGDYQGNQPVTLLRLGAIDASAGDWDAATFAFHAGRIGLIASPAEQDVSDAVRGVLEARQSLADAEARVLGLRF